LLCSRKMGQQVGQFVKLHRLCTNHGAVCGISRGIQQWFASYRGSSFSTFEIA
jgi:hypothetical protein